MQQYKTATRVPLRFFHALKFAGCGFAGRRLRCGRRGGRLPHAAGGHMVLLAGLTHLPFYPAIHTWFQRRAAVYHAPCFITTAW
jgi:hypothetical protein